MVTFGTRKAGNGRKSRSVRKYMRGTKFFKNYEGSHLPMKVNRGYSGHCKIVAEGIERFLMANVGRPVDKVYSEFLKRCDSTVTNPRAEFLWHIDKKGEIGWWGGFYISNGILNYKKRRKRNNSSTNKTPAYSDLNRCNMPSSAEVIAACHKSKNVRGKVYLGKFYVRDGYYNTRLASVYVVPKGTFTWPETNITVIGYGELMALHTLSYNGKERTKVFPVSRWNKLMPDWDVYELVAQ